MSYPGRPNYAATACKASDLCHVGTLENVVWRGSVYSGLWGPKGGGGGGSGSGADRKDWGVIQSPHKWIWLIEGASDPDWCTAGAPLIGEGGEWRREQREKRKREYGPQRNCIPNKNHAKH